MSAPIELTGLHKRFGDVRALDGLDLTVRRGTVCAILGHNGAGKTTTLRTLLGLVRPDAGTVRVLGDDPLRDGRRVRARVGVVLDRDGLYERLSAEANLDYHARLHGLTGRRRRAAVEAGLRRFGLWQRRRERIAGWSTGQRKQLALARALLHEPELLLLDEPFAGLDPVAATEVRALLAGLARDGDRTVVLTTHDLAHVERACDHVVVAERGRVLAQGSLGELRAQADELTVLVRGAGLTDALLDRLRDDGVVLDHVRIDDGVRVRCPATGRPRLAAALVGAGVALEELRPCGASLEDLFLALVAGRDAEAA
ncbi:MAG: ABC transporter ATP-binding protein [Kofleriaceae bacterium]|nr:ABC transporter ATP-binding protein [Kofleriaceae bacterium]